MDAYSPIRIVHPSEFLAGTAQTSGSVRLAAIAPESALDTALWGGLFEVKPRAHTGISSSRRAANDRIRPGRRL